MRKQMVKGTHDLGTPHFSWLVYLFISPFVRLMPRGKRSVYGSCEVNF